MVRISRSQGLEARKLAVAACGAIALGYALALVLLFVRHQWILDALGHPVVADFVEVWVAGQSVLHGHPALPYDWHAHHAAQIAAIGHPFAGFLGWHYPPHVLFMAAALAMMPYAPAFAAWIAATAALYAATIWKIAGRPEAALVALAVPAALGNAIAGQNGFFTAAIVGFALLALENRPWVAGVLLGLLTYKPQFGLLFPLVLLLDGNWRAIVVASVTTLVLLALAWLAFGAAPFTAFLHYMPITANTILGAGTAGFGKLQSVYGLVRWLGGGSGVAWLAYGAVAAAAACGTFWLWRRPVPFALKAAALATATIFATPYLYMYDFPLLAVPIAFLYRARGFDRVEIAAMIAGSAAMLVFAWTPLPIGPLLALLTAVLITRRCLELAPRDVALQHA